ncbi:MAG TPA: hypothetical protein VMR90_16245 [Candidatus Cybelea sp.]|nr:hypothetical protein [Candidatus Cybelea sp.]
MRFIKPLLLTVMASSLATYAFACSAMSTPDAAMQCCSTMPCSSDGHEHSQECCKTMPSMHSPFLQPASAEALSFSPVFVEALTAFRASEVLDFPANVLTAQCHAPPISRSMALSPLRI